MKQRLKNSNEKKRIRIKTGDIIAIPVLGNKYAYGRVFKDTSIGILKVVSDDIDENIDFSMQEVVLVAGIFDTAIKSGEWPIIKNCPFNSEDESWSPPRFIQDPIDANKFRVYHKGEMRPTTKEDIKGLDQFLIFKPYQLIERIKLIFKK